MTKEYGMQTVDRQTAAVGDWVVDTNWSVYGADLAKIGTVDDVQPEYLVVGKGLFFRRQRYIPVSTIFNVERRSIYINVSKQDIEDRGWDQAPASASGHVAAPDTTGQAAGPARSASARAI